MIQRLEERTRSRADAAWERLGAPSDDETPSEQYRRLRLTTINSERDEVLRIRSEGTVDHDVIEQVLATLDIEESMLTVATERADRLRGDDPVATGAWRRRTDVEVGGSRLTAEVKRMYVAPRARHRGLARQLLGHLERTAREAGAEVMVLETGERQPEAIALYESSGYVPIPGYGYYRDSPVNRCFARPL